MSSLWVFAPDFDGSGRPGLDKFHSFDEIAESIRLNAQILDACVCEGEDLGPKDCWRPAVILTIDVELFDAFFNSQSGYRAQYLSSADCGQAANSELLRAMEPRLTDSVVARCGENRLSRECIGNAFLANSAKIWPDEEALDFTEATIDLAIGRWKQRCEWINAPAGAGLWAPKGTRLKVFGAFIDPWGNEIVSRKKILRRFDISERGFS